MSIHARLLFYTLPVLLCQCQSPAMKVPYGSAPAPPLQGQAVDAQPLPASPARTAPPPSAAISYPVYPAEPDPSSAWRLDQVARSSLSHPAARHHEVRLVSPDGSARLDVVVFDSRQLRLAVIDQPEPQAGGRVIAGVMRAHQAVAGVNGGFFSPEFKPIGLTIAGGKPLAAFTRSSLISGMILQLEKQPFLIWNAEYQGHDGARDVLQAGPRLVANGRPVSGLDTSKRRARSFVATDGEFLWAIGTAETCSLGELSRVLVTPGALPGMTARRALNLDGGNSTALWLNLAGGKEMSRPGWSTVRNYLAVVPK